jgi:hypothetical protein
LDKIMAIVKETQENNEKANENYRGPESLTGLYYAMQNPLTMTGHTVVFNDQNKNIVLIKVNDIEVIQYINLVNKNLTRIVKLEEDRWQISIWQCSPIVEMLEALELALLSLVASKEPNAVYIIESKDSHGGRIETGHSGRYPNSTYREIYDDRLASLMKSYSTENISQARKDYFAARFKALKLFRFHEVPFAVASGEVAGYIFSFEYNRSILELSIYEKELNEKREKEGSQPLWFTSIEHPNSPVSTKHTLGFCEFIEVFSSLLEKLEKAPYTYRFPFTYDSDVEDPYEDSLRPHEIPAHSVEEAIRILRATRDPHFYNLTPLSQDDRVYPKHMPDFKSLSRG